MYMSVLQIPLPEYITCFLTCQYAGPLSRAPGKNQEKKLILFRQNSPIAAQADF
jgi:hypothetical protein